MWFVLSLAVAFFSSFYLIISKKILHKHDHMTFLFLSIIATLPFMIGIIYVQGGLPETTSKFYQYVFITSVLDFIAFIAIAKAIKMSEVSLISPISSFTPAFVVLTAWFFLREAVTPVKLVGILTIVTGSYLLNIQDIHKGLFAPIRSLASNKGIQLAMFTAFVWSITPVFQKSAIFETTPQNPMFTSFAAFFLISIYFGVYLFVKKIPIYKKMQEQLPMYLLIGLVAALNQLFGLTAFALTNLAYSSAIFKLSTLITIALGAILFKEHNIRERLLGATVILVGTILLVV